MRAIVLLPADLAAVRLAGRPLADHWAFVAAQAALHIEPVPPDATLDGAPAIVVDGRHAAVAPESLAALAARGQGALLSPAGDVVAAILDAPGGPLAERLAAAVGVEAVVAPAEGLRVDEDPGAVEAVVRRRWLAALAAGGARFVDPERTLVDTTALVGIGAVIWPGTALLGQTRIGAGAEVQAGGWIEDSAIGAGAVVHPYTVATGADVGPGAHVGPFAHLRKGAVLEPESKVGNFVEMKQARLGRGAKASHLTYLGDAEVGAHANIGAGTITCNYDGYGKYRTTIGEGAFVGSNTALVAPVSVGAGAIIGAGSVVTQDVPADALFVERAVPKLSEGRAPSLRERNRLRAESKKK